MFLSERNVKRQLFRVKQLADQTFARAEKSEVLTDDLVNAEKRVEIIKHVCTNAVKKITAGLQGQGTDGPTIDKRLKKLPDFQLAATMFESSSMLGDASILGATFSICGKAENELASCLLTHEVEVEKLVIAKLKEVLDNDIPSITKLRKHLSKLTLDMDSAKNRHLASRHDKVEIIKEELDDATTKVFQCKDALAEEMFSLLAKEHDLSQCVLHLVKSQADYHRKVLGALEGVIPDIEKVIENHSSKPVYGFPLEEHLRITERKVALPIETCACFLMECGLEEEGLFRIAGSSSKVKKLKNAFDAGYVDMTDYVRDPHAVAGALKQYLRELPVPLMTFILYEEWLDTARHTETDSRLKAMWNVIRELPEPYYNNLRYLVKFLAKLTDLHEMNKMSPQNVAIVMGPNLMWSPNDDPSTLGMNMSLTNTYSSIVDLLITYADYFFEGEEEFFVSSPRGYLTEYLNSVFPPTSADSISNGDIDEHTINTADTDVQTISSGNNKSTSPKFCSSPKLPRRIKKPAPPVPPTPVIDSPQVIASSPVTLRPKAASLPERPPICERPRGHERKPSLITSDVLSKNISATESSKAPSRASEYSVQSSNTTSVSNSNPDAFHMASSVNHVRNNSINGPVSAPSSRPQPVPRPNITASKSNGSVSSVDNDSRASSIVLPSGPVVDDCPFADDESLNRDAEITPPSPEQLESLEIPDKSITVRTLRNFDPPIQKAEVTNTGVTCEKPVKIRRTLSQRNAVRLSEQPQENVDKEGCNDGLTRYKKYSTNSVDRSGVKSCQNYVDIYESESNKDNYNRSLETTSELNKEPEENSVVSMPPPERPEKFDRNKIMPPTRPEKSDRLKALLDHKQVGSKPAEPSNSSYKLISFKMGNIFGTSVKEKPARPSYSPSSICSKDVGVNNSTTTTAEDSKKDQDSSVIIDVAVEETFERLDNDGQNDLTPRSQQGNVCSSTFCPSPSSPGQLIQLKPPRPQPRPPLPPVARPRSIAVVNPEQTHL